MSNISKRQMALLNAAAVSPDGIVDASSDGPRLTSGLVRQGLAIIVPGEGETRRLLITAEGRAKVAPPAETEAKSPKGSAAEAKAPAPTKLSRLVDLLQSEQGATLPQLMAETGWQAHSVRGAIAGAIKTKLGHQVVSEKTDAGRVYRIVQPA